MDRMKVYVKMLPLHCETGYSSYGCGHTGFFGGEVLLDVNVVLYQIIKQEEPYWIKYPVECPKCGRISEQWLHFTLKKPKE